MLRNLSRILLVLGAAILAVAPGLSAQTGGQPVRGDVDGDGRVTAADARIVADYLVGRAVPAGIDVAARGDVNGDGRVTAADAAIINAYAAGRENAKRFPVGTPVVTAPNPDGLAAVLCGVDVRAGTITCGAPTPAAGGVRAATIGGQRENVELTSSNRVSTLVGSVYDFSFDVTVKNLVPQILGTEDGVTADSIHVFFATMPTADVGSGQITVDSAGTAMFTASNQTYYSYPGLLADSVTTPARRWFFKVPNTVTHFQFLLYVDAKLQFPSGWVDIYPPTHAPSPYLVPTNTVIAGATLQLQDTVRNHLGHVVTGQTVTWSSTGHGAATVDANTGLVTAVAPGVDTVTATSGTRSGRVEIVVTPGAPQNMTKVAGHDSTTVVAGNNVPADSLPTVKVTDAGGHPVPGVAVSFTLSPNSGSLANGPSNGSVVIDSTDAAGVASVTGWTLSHTAGVYNVIASSTGLTSLTFTSTVKPGAPSSMTKVAGHDNASAVVNSGVHPDSLPSVLVADGFGNPVPGVGVTFAVTSGGGSVTGGSQTTNASGIATVGSWTLGTTAGANTVDATSAGLATLTFTATGRPGLPANIDKTAGDLQTGTSGVAVPIAPAVHVTDSFGNAVPGAIINFTVIGGGGSTTAASPATDALGNAVVGSWTLGSGPNTNKLQVAAAVGTASPDTFTAYIPPVATTDLSQAMGNHTLPSGMVPNVLANDITINGGSLVVTTVDSITTVRGGRVLITPGGVVTTFVPAAGVTGRDSAQYTINDGHVSATGWLKFAFIGKVWHVDQSYAGAAGAADGRDFRPFTSIAAAEAVAGVNDTILVHTGGGLTAGGTLKNGQTLRGQGHTAAFTATINGQSLTLLPTGTAPQVGGLTLGSGNTLRGFRVVNASGGGITGTSVGTLSLGEMAISATGGPAFDLASGTVVGIGGTGAAALDSVRSTNSTSTGVALTNVGGTLIINGGTTSAITNPTGAAVSITGSNPTFTFPGAVSKANGSGTGINLSSMSGGTVSFTGPSVVLNTGSGTGINMASSAATVSFVDSVKVTTTTGNGINATGGGTLTIAGTHNSINSAGGIALNVSSTTIGAGGLNFRSISANGGSNGIVLSNTGTTAGLTVAGTGTAGSGGTITNTTGADNAVAGNGVYLSSAQKVSLSWMNLSNHQNNGIFGTAVRTVTLDHLALTGNQGNSNVGGSTEESAIHLVDVGGPVSIRNSAISGGAYDNVRIRNDAGTSPAVDSLVFANNTLGTMQGSSVDVRNHSVAMTFSDGTADVRIRKNQVNFWWGTGIDVVFQGAASSTNVAVTGNRVSQTNATPAPGASGIVVDGGNIKFDISADTVLFATGAAIAVDEASNLASTFHGSISNNVIGTAGVTNSGSSQGSGISVIHLGGGTSTVNVTNNVIRQINGIQAILLQAGDASASGGNGTFNTTVTGNDIQQEGSTLNSGRSAIILTSGTAAGDGHLICADIGGAGALSNNIVNFNSSSAGNDNRIRPNQRFSTTLRMPGYGGANNDNAAVATYLLGRNTASRVAASNSVSTGGGGYVNTPGGAACPQP